MTSPESMPRHLKPEDSQHPAQPDEPTELAALIDDTLVDADTTGGELPEWGARAVARSLAALGGDPTPALEHFAATADGDLETISREAMPIYNEPSCTAWVKQQIDYLLTFLLNRERPLATPPAAAPAPETAPPESEVAPAIEVTPPRKETPPTQVVEGIREHGDAFRAFLTLPDIKPDAPDLLDSFHEFYVGHFSDFSTLVDSLTEIASWESEIEALADRHGIPGYISLDMEAIEAHVRDTWDIIAYHGTLYVFDK